MRPQAELDLPVSLDRSAPTPLHSQVAAALRDAVVDGLLAPGSRLPPTRLLATRLAVARSTVLAAYEQLDGEGYLDSRHGSGTYISTRLPTAAAAPTAAGPPPAGHVCVAATTGRAGAHWRRSGAVDVRPGRPDTGRAAAAAWRCARRRAASRAVPPVAAHLRAARGLRADAADVFITAGTSDGLALVVHALALAACTVAVEDPGHPAAWRVLTRLGSRLVPVPVDGDGLCVDRLAALPVAPHLVLVTPSHQYPLGGCLPLARRLALLDWAHRHDALVLEDDYNSEFRFGVAPLPALAGLDRTGSVVHLGTFSKVLTPWLRVGYLLAPARLRAELLAARTDLRSVVSGLDQRALARYLASGALRRHIARTRRDYAHRRRHLARLVAAQPVLRLHGTRGGLHAVVGLPHGTDVTMLLEACAQQGLLLADLHDYAAGAGPHPHPAVIIGYGAATLTDLDRAISTLARLTQ